MRNERERLFDILEAIERIEKYAMLGKSAFENDELVQNWMVNHISVIGEACRTIPEEFRAEYSGVPWADIIAMRNLLVHHYFGIDTDAVWMVVERDIPELKMNIQLILADLNKSGEL
jgi:uncharacterized protein with HEPN domain